MRTHEWDPGQLIQTAGDYWKSCVLHASVKLELFTAIGDKRLASDDIAQRIHADGRALAMLLNALTAMNLVSKRGNRYSNTPSSRSFLSKDSPQYIGDMIMVYHYMSDSWFKLDQAVLSGEPVRVRPFVSEERYRESFLKGTSVLAMSLAPRLAEKIDLSKRTYLLDLAGGTGIYAIHFCLSNPQLRAIVYDLPSTRPFAEKTIERFGLRDRVGFSEGDYLHEDIRGRYDAAFLSQVLHAEAPEDCRRIIQKTASALQPGGTIIIHDLILNDNMDGPLFPALFSLNMLLLTPKGQSYSERQITDMLEYAGVKEIRCVDLDSPIESRIITGVVE